MNLHATLPLDEAPIAAGDGAIPRVLPDETAVLDAIDSRRVELHLANSTVEQLAGLCVGHLTKICGPSRERSPTLGTITRPLDALGLSITLVTDPSKTARMQPSWRPRNAAQVRQLLGEVTLQRARPAIVAQLARRASRPRWANVPAKDFMRAMAREAGT
jgi:hypothetical protein